MAADTAPGNHELLDLDATAQAELVRTGEITAVELLQASIDAVERIDKQLDSVLHKAFDYATEMAKNVDTSTPFCGVPMVFKDYEQAVKGIPFSFATMPFLKHSPWTGDEDGNFAASMRAAGSVFLGRSTSSLGAFFTTHDIEAHTMPRNPWNPEHSTAGSSCGSAAAVAARIVPIGHGGDGGGSIRLPASFCGVVGMKPTRGRVSVGHDRSEVFHFGSAWSHEFAMTRTVRDTARLLDATQGWRPGDSMPLMSIPSIPDRAGLGSGSLSIGLTTTPFNADYETDPEIAAATEQVARVLEGMGHTVVPVTPYRYDFGAHEWFYGAPAGTHFTQIARLVDKVGQIVGRPVTKEDVGPQMWGAVQAGRETSLINYLEFAEVLQGHILEFDKWWASTGIDVLLSPTVAILPPPIAKYLPPPHGTFDTSVLEENPMAGLADNGDHTACTHIYNMTGQPAISLPLAVSASGLPIGIQLAAARMQDERLLRLSYDLEEALPWAGRRPAICASS